MCKRKNNGFTLIELLVVISIIVVLAGLLIPGILKAMKQAKANRALSEMQHLSTVITQIYSEVGCYVRLEDLAQKTAGDVRRWLSSEYDTVPPPSDAEVSNTLDVNSMWNGPYTTYKNYVVATPFTGFQGFRPLDPWGTMGNSDADKHQYRMFWIKSTGSTDIRVPAGANGAMVIISAGGDGVYNCNIGTANKAPNTADNLSFATFDPSIDKGDDAYYIFNAGIQ